MTQNKGMVKDTLEKRVGKLSLLDAFLVGGSKLTTEMLMAKMPMVGNGTVRSGAIKTVSALAISGLGRAFKLGKLTDIPATGLVIDGMEDFAIQIKARLSGIKNNNTTNNTSGQQVFVSPF